MKTDKEYAKRDTTAVKCDCGNVVYIAPDAKLLTPHCPVCGTEVEELKKHTQPKVVAKPEAKPKKKG